MPVTLAFLAAGLAACSDDKPLSETQPAAVTSNKTSPVTPLVTNTSGYRVLDTFNVGDSVYVRSMAVDKKNKSLWVGTSVGVLEVNLTDNNLAERLHDIWLKYCPSKRIGTAEEIASLVHFLTTKDAGFINGESIRVAGGLSYIP